jgi:hypothetical protein
VLSLSLSLSNINKHTTKLYFKKQVKYFSIPSINNNETTEMRTPGSHSRWPDKRMDG